MPRYCYFCPECGYGAEVAKPMSESNEPLFCFCNNGECEMNRDFRAENIHVGAGSRSYHKPIISDSMAMNPEQIPEHRRKFPDIQVTPEGQPVFDNFADHEAYMEKCNIEKVPQRRKKKGKRIA